MINSLSEASTAFAEAKKVGGKSSSELDMLKNEGARIAVEKGQASYQKNDFKEAALAFEQVYRLSPRDTLFLYNRMLFQLLNARKTNGTQLLLGTERPKI